MSKKTLETITETMFYVLMSFLKTPMCGTDIAAYISAKTKGRIQIGPGTLYTILGKFEEERLIQEIRVEGRKRTYQLTDKGRQIYQEECARLLLCIQDAESEEFQ